MSETIQLQYPVTLDGHTYDALHIRRPKVKDHVAADKQGNGQMDTEITLFANLCEVPKAVIEDLDMIDYGSVQEVYQDFLSLNPKASASPS